MKNNLLVILAGGLLCVSTAGAGQTVQSNTVQTQAKAKEKTYCLKSDGDSGSHVKRVECRTKKQWKALGVDIDAVEEDGA